MITIETLEQIGRKYHSQAFPNIAREYIQHVFLGELYRLPESNSLLFKGGTALRIIYGSPRFSEDLDFSLIGANLRAEDKDWAGKFTEPIFMKVLAEIEKGGIRLEIGEKSAPTSGGYFGVATAQLFDYAPITLEINVSTRKLTGAPGELDSIAGDFAPTYTLVHLPQTEMVEEKIFGALLSRKKPRDFYDLYFLMRRGMLSPDQKGRLATVKDKIISYSKAIDFEAELEEFLPSDHQAIIRDFTRTLAGELNRQTA